MYGGPTSASTLDDCGNVNATITGGGGTVGVAYDFGTGLTAAFGADTGYVGPDAALNAASTVGDYNVSVSYTKDESKNANNTSYGSSNDFTFGFGTGKLTNIGNIQKAYNTSLGYQALNGVVDVGSYDVDGADFADISYDELGAGSFGLATTQGNKGF